MKSSGVFYMIELKNQEEYDAVCEYIGKTVLNYDTFIFLKRSVDHSIGQNEFPIFTPTYTVFVLGLSKEGTRGAEARRCLKKIENLLNTMREG